MPNVLQVLQIVHLVPVVICLVAVMPQHAKKSPPPDIMLMKVRKNSIPVVEPLDNVVPSI